MLDEEALGPERSEVQFLEGCSPRDMSKRYDIATSLNCGSGNQKIKFETFGDMYLAEFSLELEPIEDLYLGKLFLAIEGRIPPSNMPSDEMMLVVEHGKSTDEFNTHNNLYQIPFNHSANSFIVVVHEAGANLCVWDPRISLNSMAPTGYTVNMDLLQLLGSTGKFSFISYVNSTTQVWDPGQQLCMNSYIVEIIENKMVGLEINGISLTTIKADNADSQKEGSQSSCDGLHSTTNTSILHLQAQSLGQRARKLCFQLFTSTYQELLEPYMQTPFELTTEASDQDEDVVALQAIELWSKVPKLDGLQCYAKNCSFRWINHLQLGLETQLFSPEEEELIVTLHVFFEQRRAQIATQLTETSQDQLVGFLSPDPAWPTHNFGLLLDKNVLLGSRCAIGEMIGVVMRGKIEDFFGERGALCFSESFCHVGWLVIIFGRNVSWFDIGSVLMGYGVISFMVPTYITEITPKHLEDSFAIINQLLIRCGGSLIIQLFGLFFIRDSGRWLTKDKHWKACPTSLQHLRRNTANIFSNISPKTTSVKEFIPILQLLSMAKMLDFLKRKYACFLILGVGLVVLHQIGQVKAAAYYAIIIVILTPKKYISFLSIPEGYVNNITCTGVVSTYGTCQPVAFAPVEVPIPTSSLSLSFVVGFLDSNLEDKVLIEDESIVMNQVQPNVNTKVTQVVIGLTRAIGPRTSNRARLIWDPG